MCWYTAPMAGTGPLRPVLSFLCSLTLTTEHCMDSWYILLSLLRKLVLYGFVLPHFVVHVDSNRERVAVIWT